MKNAYFLSHNGLGDHITNIGAVLFLLQYYETIFLLCKDVYQSNVIDLFKDKSVITIPFDSSNEFSHSYQIIKEVSETDDVFISGCHKESVSSRITVPEILQYVKKKHSVDYDHINIFYDDIGLDTSIYVDYFHIESTQESKKCYEDIRSYSIIFLHTKASNRSIQLTELVDRYKSVEQYILICANENVYQDNHPHHSLSHSYVNRKIVDYMDIIYHAKEIHVINSCFSCIVYPLLLGNKIHPEYCKIYDGCLV